MINPSLLLKRSPNVIEFRLCEYRKPTKLSPEMKLKAKSWADKSNVWKVSFIGNEEMNWTAFDNCNKIDI